jgi:hypothetical protein
VDTPIANDDIAIVKREYSEARNVQEWANDLEVCVTGIGTPYPSLGRTQTIQDVAKEHMLDLHTIKELDKRYIVSRYLLRLKIDL